MNTYTVRVHFIDGSERIVPATNIQPVGEEGARRATALYEGKEYPIYNRVEWGFLWYEQETPPASKKQYSPRIGDYRIEKQPNPEVEDKHFVWRFAIDGVWEFVEAMDEMRAGDFVAEKEWLTENEKYDYWR